MKNIKRKPDFSQVCIWPATIVGCDEGKGLEDWMLKEFKTRVQYLEEIKTKPDLDSNDEPVKDTGGRNDLFFAVHKEDVNKFAVSRLSLGIRWIEDAYSKNPIYPERVLDYASWNKENIIYRCMLK